MKYKRYKYMLERRYKRIILLLLFNFCKIGFQIHIVTLTRITDAED